MTTHVNIAKPLQNTAIRTGGRILKAAIFVGIVTIICLMWAQEANAMASYQKKRAARCYKPGPIPRHICILIVQEAPHVPGARRAWGRNPHLAFIIRHESGFNFCAVNPGRVDCSYTGSRACGLFQRLPCKTHVFRSRRAQIRDGLAYIAGRYGTPGAARRFWLTHGWY